MSKKKIFAGLLTTTMAAAILVTAAVPASAALPPQGVRSRRSRLRAGGKDH